MLDVIENEQKAYKWAKDAYFKACETSNPQHWMEAAMLAQQHRNALDRIMETLFKRV